LDINSRRYRAAELGLLAPFDGESLDRTASDVGRAILKDSELTKQWLRHPGAIAEASEEGRGKGRHGEKALG